MGAGNQLPNGDPAGGAIALRTYPLPAVMGVRYMLKLRLISLVSPWSRACLHRGGDRVVGCLSIPPAWDPGGEPTETTYKGHSSLQHHDYERNELIVRLLSVAMHTINIIMLHLVVADAPFPIVGCMSCSMHALLLCGCTMHMLIFMRTHCVLTDLSNATCKPQWCTLCHV